MDNLPEKNIPEYNAEPIETVKGEAVGEDYIPGQSDEESKNYKFEKNHITITVFFLEYLSKNTTAPAIHEIVKETNLSYRTVTRHLKEIDFSRVTDKYLFAADAVIGALVQRAIKTGDPKAVKLYAGLVLKWSEKQILEFRDRRDFRDLREELSDSKDTAEKIDKLNQYLLNE